MDIEHRVVETPHSHAGLLPAAVFAAPAGASPARVT